MIVKYTVSSGRLVYHPDRKEKQYEFEKSFRNARGETYYRPVRTMTEEMTIRKEISQKYKITEFK